MTYLIPSSMNFFFLFCFQVGLNFMRRTVGSYVNKALGELSTECTLQFKHEKLQFTTPQLSAALCLVELALACGS